MMFYDTCSLLADNNLSMRKNIILSSISIQELENIKTSAHKDDETKYAARRVVKIIKNNPENFRIKYWLEEDWDKYRIDFPFLPDTNDSRILISYLKTKEDYTNLKFVTEDLLLWEFGYMVNADLGEIPKVENYKGYIIYECKTYEGMGKFYSDLYESPEKFILYENQYLLLKDVNGEIIDKYKMKNNQLQKIPYTVFKSKHFGTIKPKDDYQQCLMDSLMNNQLTIAGGKAGAGKSYLSLGYLFQELEKNNIDRIIIFCNTVATNGSAKLGYYPGSREEKLLDSQIGNFLSSKIGDRTEVERLIDEGMLLLLPMSDIRGFDTTGMKAGIYITEAQNLDINLMQLALQRIGEDCICILDGDAQTQVDMEIYGGSRNGLRKVSEIFKGQDFFGQMNLPIVHRSRIANLAGRMTENV